MSLWLINVGIILRTNIASVGSVFSDTRKVKVLSLPETIKEKSTFRAKALRRELLVGVGQNHMFLYELIQKHPNIQHTKNKSQSDGFHVSVTVSTLPQSEYFP